MRTKHSFVFLAVIFVLSALISACNPVAPATPPLAKGYCDFKFEFPVLEGNSQDFSSEWKDWQKWDDASKSKIEVNASVIPYGADMSKFWMANDLGPNPYLYTFQVATTPDRESFQKQEVAYSYTGNSQMDQVFRNCAAANFKTPKVKGLQFLGQVVVTTIGRDFTSDFYLGKILPQKEILKMGENYDNYIQWTGTGFIGGGTSSGNFTISKETGKLTWNYFVEDPEAPTGISIPTNQEILVHTTGTLTNGEVWSEWQKFVWTEKPYNWSMIEEKDFEFQE